jgi:cytochrome c5
MNIFLDYKNANFVKLSLIYFLFIFFSQGMLPQNSLSEVRNGKNIYEISCSVCHQAGLAGAPIFGNSSSWGERKNKTLEELTYSVKNGLRGMPAMGLCLNCSMTELEEAVQFMLNAL